MAITKIITETYDLECLVEGDPTTGLRVIIVPGFLENIRGRNHTSLAQTLSENGHYVIVMNPPGAWESEGTENNYSMTNTIRAAQGLVDLEPDRPTVLIGTCTGGILIPSIALGHSNIIGCVFITADTRVRQYDSTNTMTRSENEQWKLKGVREIVRNDPANNYQRRTFSLPYEYLIDAQGYDSSEARSTMTIPKLFILATYDSTVPCAQAKKDYDATAEPKKLVEIDCDHKYWLQGKTEIVHRNIGNFLDSLQREQPSRTIENPYLDNI